MFLLKDNAIREKTALLFLLKLLILMCLLKCIFFAYNYQISNGWSITGKNVWPVLGLSLLFDGFILCLVNVPLFLFLLAGGRLLKQYLMRKGLAVFTAVLNAFVILLNSFDIFYFPFHLQRADADLLYVIRNPLFNSTAVALLLMFVVVAFFTIVWWQLYKNILRLLDQAKGSSRMQVVYLLPILFVAFFVLTGPKKLLPTYALAKVEAVQLPLAQNSFHSFIYSLYRRNQIVLPANNYMPASQQLALFSIHKKNSIITPPKNIVLFIMESVPLEFFDSSSPYKVQMPFMDSLVTQSTYFSNAFSYSYNSNKGITAVLAGLPTIIDIPLYHSNFTGINKTAVGSVLGGEQYKSAFFIGDNYDDFGFAKCCKWLGIEQYYCMQDIPGYKNKEKHSLGLHDEYVLEFMQVKLAKLREPFFSVQYNISTHYPNDLPASFKNAHPANKTDQQKSMQYYNECLERFFRNAAREPWYKNSVFIFCSDHWVQPTNDDTRIHEVNSFRIPLFIHEPGKKGTRVSTPVSQLDILNTVLSFASIKDTVISYGESLSDPAAPGRTVFTKVNGAVYQAINDEYVLGFDAITSKALYCFNYKTDPGLTQNLIPTGHAAIIQKMTLQIQAFLQTASIHYRK